MTKKHGNPAYLHRKRRWLNRVFVILAMLIVGAGFIGSATTETVLAGPGSAPQFQTNTLTINVVSARDEPRALGGAGVLKGDAVSTFKYIINIDNTGTTVQRPDPVTGEPPLECTPEHPNYPASCDWVSIAGAETNAPIYTQGDQSDFANGGLTLPPGRYLISVLADGYKLDGEHFTIPLTDPGPVTVELQPFPLPDATIRAFVFEDNAPTNMGPDIPAERGLAGFSGHIIDYIGEITTDIYGNPLCTLYEGEDPVTHEFAPGALQPPDYQPVPIPGTGGECLSDANGLLVIPHVGPARYALAATKPDGTDWVQTTTLEGNHDWDTWIMENATGYDTEFVRAGEQFPTAIFGYVKPNPTTNLGGAGEIRGVVDAFRTYLPAKGGVLGGGENTFGSRVDKPIPNAWVSLTDLQGGDTAVWIGQTDENGAFTIPNVPDGNYFITWWDEPQNYIMNWRNVTVSNGEVVDLGLLPLNSWWTQLEGYVFEDSNRNGYMDPGEKGLANFPVAARKRENALMDRGAQIVTTDATGYYYMENLYPMNQWLIIEAYSDLYYTTGVTYQSDNQPEPTTILGNGVDVAMLPIIGLGGRLDWGVHAYAPTGGTPGVDPDNGGIVGTVSYDTTRNEIDARFAAVEDWQPGVPGLTMKMYAPVPCGAHPGTPCDASGRYELDPNGGAFAKGQLLNTTVTESYQRPGLNNDGNCIPRDVNNNPFVYPQDQQITKNPSDCLEAPLMSVQFQSGFATVDGNYGFGDACFNGTLDFTDPANPVCVGGTFEPLTEGDYLVEVEIPNDATGKPMYKVTREEDINVANGDQFTPQIPPPECAGPLHTVDVAGISTDGWPANTTFIPGVTVPASTPTVNPTFADDLGGSYYEGEPKPLCSTKLIRVSNGRSVAPLFNLFTDVPLPSRFWGLIVDDLNFSSDPKSLLYGEKAGVPFAPVGIYDFDNRLITTVESDYNGLWDVLLPSTNRINCPTPSGVCANVYRTVGNDPGIPGRLNPNYKPQFRTISADFETLVGLTIVADLAPTQMGLVPQLPGGQFNHSVSCSVNDPAGTPTIPELFSVSKPYIQRQGNGAERTFTINGIGFGNTAGDVTLDGIPLRIMSWSDTTISARVRKGGANAVPPGPHQLKITAANGKSNINGLTMHILRGNGPVAERYNPTVYEVGPGMPYAIIQDAIDDAVASNADALVVVYPGQPDLTNPLNNPRGAYYENLIISAPIKLQGVGPGGFQGTTFVPGSIIDGSSFAGDTGYSAQWRQRVQGMTWIGNQTISEGEVILMVATSENQYNQAFHAAVDGFDLRGGDQQGQPNLITQGGALLANAYVRNLQMSNNIIESNNSSYGTVRVGTPHLPAPDTNQHNENFKLLHNRIIHNAGTNLAGAVGIFAGADNYELAYNDICGNFSAEYGGGITVYGLSPNGQIHHNRVYYNESYDEAGGIMIAGELPANPTTTLSPGSGPTDVYNNLIQNNLGGDDGGGLRFLMAGNYPMNIYNNIIVNNISGHEGGGIALNDTPDARIFNNTIMKNMTTASALTSLGFPAPAGLSTSANSDLMQASLPAGAPVFSNPLLYNNIFWDNRAGMRGLGTVTGLGSTGDTSPINNWDMGVADGTGVLAPTNTILQTLNGTIPDASNSTQDPQVVSPYDSQVTFNTWRNNPVFVDAVMIVNDLPPNLLGDYHLQNGSPAVNMGAPTKAGVNAPTFDFDDDGRPWGGDTDAGADEATVGTPPGPPNQPPVAVFTFDCPSLACSFDGSVSNDPDGAISQYAWDFGDGTPVVSGASATVNHTYGAAGTYNVTLTVTDNATFPETASTGQILEVSNAVNMDVAGLAGSSYIIRKGQPTELWRALATITVRDSHNLPVDGATVTMQLTRIDKRDGHQTSRFLTCTTVGGECSTGQWLNPRAVEDTVTFNVVNVTHPTLVYDANLWNIETIQVSKP